MYLEGGPSRPQSLLCLTLQYLSDFLQNRLLSPTSYFPLSPLPSARSALPLTHKGLNTVLRRTTQTRNIQCGQHADDVWLMIQSQLSLRITSLAHCSVAVPPPLHPFFSFSSPRPPLPNYHPLIRPAISLLPTLPSLRTFPLVVIFPLVCPSKAICSE
jgi:hypothetical protein